MTKYIVQAVLQGQLLNYLKEVYFMAEHISARQLIQVHILANTNVCMYVCVYVVSRLGILFPVSNA